jgi:hypothetical protein
VERCSSTTKPSFISPLHLGHFRVVVITCFGPPWNDSAEQIAGMDSQLRRTLSRVCSNAWFGEYDGTRDRVSIAIRHGIVSPYGAPVTSARSSMGL